MTSPQELWQHQRDPAVDIRDEFDWQKALGYFIGEKFVNYLRPGAPRGVDVEAFAHRIRLLFPRGEIESYFKTVTPDAESCPEPTKEGMPGDSPTDPTADMLILARARKLILG